MLKRLSAGVDERQINPQVLKSALSSHKRSSISWPDLSKPSSVNVADASLTR